MSDPGGWPARPLGRGQASVLGVVLLVGITIIGVTGVLVFGSSGLSDSHTRTEISAAEQAMTQLDSHFSVVALGGAEHRQATVPLSSGESLTVDGDRGWINVSAWNRTSGAFRYTLLNETLGAVVYENDGTEIAYQGGGVWRRQRNAGSVVVSPPEFHYRSTAGQDATLTVPLIVVEGSGSVTENVRAAHVESVSTFPDPTDPARSNPLDEMRMNLTVHSRYYEAWGSFFELRMGGNVTYDHDRQVVVLTLEEEAADPEVGGGVVSSSAGYVLQFGQQAVVDSYNSTEGPYDGGQANTSIVAAGDVELGQGAEIHGNVVTGGSLLFAGGGGQLVTGNLTYGNDYPSEPDRIDGWIRDGADPAIPESVDWLITDRGEYLKDNNDNADPPIKDEKLECEGSCTLTAGQYYIEKIDLKEDELTLDTSGGDIEIYVEKDVKLDKDDSLINVTGPNRARIYVDKDFELKKGSVTTPGDRAAAMWVYMRPGAEAEFHDAHFEGVIYGPGKGAQPGVRIKAKNQNHIYGGLVGYIPDDGEDGLGQNDEVHFDEALAEEDPLGPYGEDTVSVAYMHVTVNRVTISDG